MIGSIPKLTIAIVSFFLALLAAVYPLPPSLSAYRPEWVCLIVIYWALHTPHQMGIGVAWLMGLVQDIAEDSVWGGHALALSFVVYLLLLSYQRLRSYSLSQQTFWVFVFVGIHQLFVNWVQGLNGYGAPVQYILASALLTALLWPLLVLCMRVLQRRFRIF